MSDVIESVPGPAIPASAAWQWPLNGYPDIAAAALQALWRMSTNPVTAIMSELGRVVEQAHERAAREAQGGGDE